MKLGSSPVDLAVFRSPGEVELLVYPAGALDVVAGVRGIDLAAIVEVKAAPSKTECDTFVNDLKKLAKITTDYPDCLGFFVVFDKSLHLGGAASTASPRFDWADVIEECADGRLEAHWLHARGEPCSRRGQVAVDHAQG